MEKSLHAAWTSFWPTCSIQLISLQKAFTTKRPNMIRSVLPGFWKPVQIREARITGYEIHQHSTVIYVCFASVRGDFHQWILLLDFMRLNLYQHKPRSYISEADIYAGRVSMSHAKASNRRDLMAGYSFTVAKLGFMVLTWSSDIPFIKEQCWKHTYTSVSALQAWN